MKYNNVIDLKQYVQEQTAHSCRLPEEAELEQVCRSCQREANKLILAFEALTTLAIGVCCIACLVLVYTML